MTTHPVTPLERLRWRIGDAPAIEITREELFQLLDIAEAAQALGETPEIQMYARHEAAQAGRIGFCARNLLKSLKWLASLDAADSEVAE